jgi:hypothetical protein
MVYKGERAGRRIMGPAFYVMAILGCGEAEAACQQVAVAQTRYENLEACNAATAEAVMRNVNLSFPVVAAQCRRDDTEVAEKLMPSDIDLPEAEASAPRVQRAAYQPPRKLRL